MRPTDLKQVAVRFTEKFYPQWVTRVDRIWDMLEKIDPKSLFSDSKFQWPPIGGAFGISGELSSEFKECMSGIAIFAFTYQDSKNSDSISEDEIKKKISLVTNLNIPSGLQKKLESVFEEMLPLIDSGTNQAKDKSDGEYHKENYFCVYVPRESGIGTKKVLVRGNDLESKYLSKKEMYDIFIYQLNIEIKPSKTKNDEETIKLAPLELYSSILTLLILFLKYKDEPLSFLKLYHCAWKESRDYDENIKDSEYIIDNLKTAVSSLRKHLKLIKDFTIPSAKRNSDLYICKGKFNFCLILSQSMDQKYTLQAD